MNGPNPRPALIVVCGLPGSGKTTHARRVEAERRAVRFCPDEWMAELGLSLWDEAARARIEALQGKLGLQLLRLGLSVILEWGTWARSERDALRVGAQAAGAAAELHFLHAPVDVLFDRIQRRGAENPPIEREAIDRWFAQFEAPTGEEFSLYDCSVNLESTNSD